MKREIKFEYGFQSNNGIVKKRYYLHEIPLIKEKCDVWNDLPLVYVRQFTGFQDKNGVDIYEGKDSLELHLIGLGRGKVDVVMYKGSWSIYCESQGYAPLNEMLINTSCELKVIGDIHENK